MNASDPVAGTAVFTLGERDYIRHELDQFLSILPTQDMAGRPKVSLAARGLLDRGLMRLQATPWPPRLFFTEAGLAALRAMMSDRRPANFVTFAHVRRELGIDPAPEEP